MSDVPTVLIAYDGSASADAVIARCAGLFPGAEAVLVTVTRGLANLADAASGARLSMPDSAIHEAVAKLRESGVEEAREVTAAGVRAAEANGIDARSELVTAEGSVAAAILKVAADAGADVVACGTNGRGAAARALLGSVSWALVHDAGVPVLVVPDGAAAGDGPLLIAFDDAEHAEQAVTAAGTLFAGRAALVLHVWRSQTRHSLTGQAFRRAPLRDVRDTMSELEELFEAWAHERADHGVDLARKSGLDATGRLVESANSIAQAILDAAGEEDASAIVVGRRGRGAMASALLGSVSSSVLHVATRPVLVA